MEIVNIHCSECRGLIGINKDDLGHHVRCPLCQQIILATLSTGKAPAAAPAEPSVPAPTPPQPETPSYPAGKVTTPGPGNFPNLQLPSTESSSEKESIFAPEEDTSDSLFGEVQAPKIEMPGRDFAEEKTVAETPGEKRWENDTETISAHEAAYLTEHPAHGLGEAEATHSLLADHPETGGGQPQVEHPHHTEAPPAGGTLVQARTYEPKQSMLVPTLLIFLIPYSIFTTLFLGYLLYSQRNASKDPTVRFLEKMLEDNFKNKDNIKRIQYDLPLPDNLRTKLNTLKQIGAIEITPLKVVQTPQGDLTLYMRIKNISLDLWFNPLPPEFARFDRKKTPPVYPYIFLEGGDTRLFGGKVEWLRGEIGKEKLTRDKELKPGEAMTVTLTTAVEDRELVPKIMETKGFLLWRVQFRRGLEKLHGNDWPITCVVGMEFTPKEIVQGEPN